jgi:hypothetical protein
MISFRISEDALQDLNEGFLFYEAQEAGSVTIMQLACGQILRVSAYMRASIVWFTRITTVC